MRNVGPKLLVKLKRRGWLGERVKRTSKKERQKRKNALRLKKLKAMIQRANHQIREWQGEVARLTELL